MKGSMSLYTYKLHCLFSVLNSSQRSHELLKDALHIDVSLLLFIYSDRSSRNVVSILHPNYIWEILATERILEIQPGVTMERNWNIGSAQNQSLYIKAKMRGVHKAQKGGEAFSFGLNLHQARNIFKHVAILPAWAQELNRVQRSYFLNENPPENLA